MSFFGGGLSIFVILMVVCTFLMGGSSPCNEASFSIAQSFLDCCAHRTTTKKIPFLLSCTVGVKRLSASFTIQAF